MLKIETPPDRRRSQNDMVQAVFFVFILKDNLQKNHPISEVIISLFTFQLLRDFVPLVKFDGNTEPVMVNIQGSDTKQMAERERFELSHGFTRL